MATESHILSPAARISSFALPHSKLTDDSMKDVELVDSENASQTDSARSETEETCTECMDDTEPCLICYGAFDSRHPPQPIPCACQAHVESCAMVHKGCINQWIRKSGHCPLCRASLKKEVVAASLNIEDVWSFLISAVPEDVGTVLGTVHIQKQSASYFGQTTTRFEFFLHSPDPALTAEVPLLTATRKVTNLTTSFVISSSSGSVVAELSSSNNNLMQNVACAGRGAPKRGIWSLSLMSGAADLGHMVYNPKTLGRMCPSPRQMFCLLPEAVTNGDSSTVARSSTERSVEVNELSYGEVQEMSTQQQRVHDMLALKNREPVWNEALESFCLEFGERVRVPSKKNFQMIFADEEAPNDIVLEHGKMDDTTFSLDFQWPLSPLQAFAFALSQHI
jgi:hypothetical protein